MKQHKIIRMFFSILIIMLPIVEAQANQQTTDTTPPDITSVLLTHGPTTLVTWITDEQANSIVTFGTSTAMNFNATDVSLETTHSLTLNTTTGQTYYYRVTSCDLANNCKSTAIDDFVAGPFFVKAEIPRYPRTTKIDIPGKTRPGATITINVNGVDVRKDIITDGDFLFRNIQLLKANNTIKLKSELGTETAEANYQADVDTEPPIINVTMPAAVTTQTVTAIVRVSEPVNLTIAIGNQTQTQLLQTGSNNITINLTEGENFITFTAKDKANLTSITEEQIIYDTGPPTFVNTNLEELSPTYQQEIRVQGQLSEQGSITAFLNGKPKRTEATGEDGTFSIRVQLERTINYSTERRAALDTGISWKNKLRLEAVDAAGFNATTPEVTIEYSLCGSGTWLDVRLSNPLPTILNPRLLIEGLQQIGIGFNYTYRGTTPDIRAVINPRDVRVIIMQLAPDFAKDYDNGLIIVNAPPVRAQRTRVPSGLGYMQINFNTIDPWAIQGETAPPNATMYEKEEKLSKHREGKCLVPGLGCMKLFMQLEIPFQQISKKRSYDPKIQQSIEQEVTENLIQKTCVNVEVAIDKRIPPSYIPEGFLKGFSDVLTTAIDGIDQVLQPIQTVGQYLFYTCVAGTFISFVPLFLERYNCDFSSLTAETKFDPKVAEIGACEEEYEDEKEDNCKSCETWKNNRKKYERTYRQICDRVMCPAAPSLQYYLKTKGTQTPKDVDTIQAQNDLKAYLPKEGTQKLMTGSDCAAWVKSKKPQTEQKTVTPPRLFYSSGEIQGIYSDWLKHQPDSDGKETTQVNCAGLHPATPECCGYEYMQEWSSACGVSLLGNGLDTFDEIKQSTCLSAQAVGKNEIQGAEGETVGCNKLLNSVSGFCDKNGLPPATTKRVTTIKDDKAEALGLQKYGESRDLYIVVQEKIKGGAWIGESAGHTIKLAVVVKTLEFAQATDTDKKEFKVKESTSLTEKVGFVDLPRYEGFQDKWFSQEKIDAFRKMNDIQRTTFGNEFGVELCEAAGREPGCAGVDGKVIYEEIISLLGTPEQEYIIRPGDGLINGVRCLCFPTVIRYLKMWKDIMTAVRNCVNTILLTGDGESGVCQAVVSRYACDLLYEALACFTQKFSTGTARAEREGGDIMGALVAAGTDLSRSAEARYGQTGMYNAVFVEKKLVHSVCMWAFTGTWDLDLAAVFDQSVNEVPVDSYALLYPCNRRFIAFNPATQPNGLATWIYHFGVGFAAGADADVELKLRCSGSYRCQESNGFENGKCDCESPKEITIVPEKLPTRVKSGEIINEEIFYTMIGAPGDAQIRYDQAYLVYRWKDGATNREEKTDPCTIGLTGGPGTVPAFCRFDLFTQSYRCQFGEAAGGIRFVGAKSVYPRSDTFAIGEEAKIELQIQQDYPGKEEYNKQLEYNITDVTGRTVDTNAGRPIMLTTNGDYTKTISVPITDPNKWFAIPEPGKVYEVKQWTSRNPRALEGNTIIKDVKLFSQTGGPSNEHKQFVLELKKSTTGIDYKVYGATTSMQTTNDGFISRDPQPTCIGTFKPTLTEKSITCRSSPIIPVPGQPAIRPAFEGQLVIEFTDQILAGTRPVGDEVLQAHMDYNVQTGLTRPCDGPIKNRQPAPFKIKFTAYDSDKYGQPTDQISVDPLTGQEAIREINFNIICVTKEELEKIPTISAIEQLLKIKDYLITKENKLGWIKTQRAYYEAESKNDQKLTEYLRAENQAVAVAKIDQLAKDLEEVKKQLTALIELKLKESETSKVPNEVKLYPSKLNTAITEIGTLKVRLATPKDVTEVKTVLAEITAKLAAISDEQNMIQKSIDDALIAAGATVIPPIPLTAPGETCTTLLGPLLGRKCQTPPCGTGYKTIGTTPDCLSPSVCCERERPGVLTLQPGPIREMIQNQNYPAARIIQVSGGTSPITCELASGSPPPAMSLSGPALTVVGEGIFCELGGKPTQIGTFTFNVKVTDSSTPKKSTTGSFTIKVNSLSAAPPAAPPAPETKLLADLVGFKIRCDYEKGEDDLFALKADANALGDYWARGVEGMPVKKGESLVFCVDKRILGNFYTKTKSEYQVKIFHDRRINTECNSPVEEALQLAPLNTEYEWGGTKVQGALNVSTSLFVCVKRDFIIKLGKERASEVLQFRPSQGEPSCLNPKGGRYGMPRGHFLYDRWFDDVWYGSYSYGSGENDYQAFDDDLDIVNLCIDSEIKIQFTATGDVQPLPSTTPTPTPTPTLQPKTRPGTCGNGKVDQGELCDCNIAGDRVDLCWPRGGRAEFYTTPDEMEHVYYDENDYTVKHVTRTSNKETLLYSMNLKDWCYNNIGYDCNDRIGYAVNKGKCVDCISYKPFFTCEDNDLLWGASDGRAAFSGPRFDMVTDELRDMDENDVTYIASDPTYGNGKNPCVPAGVEPIENELPFK